MGAVLKSSAELSSVDGKSQLELVGYGHTVQGRGKDLYLRVVLKHIAPLKCREGKPRRH